MYFCPTFIKTGTMIGNQALNLMPLFRCPICMEKLSKMGE